MINQIQQIDGYESLTAQQIADALSKTTLRLDSRQTFNAITIAFDNDVMLVETMVGAMRAMGLNASADSLTTVGIDFGMPSVQAMVDVLAENAAEVFTSEIVSTLKGLGKQTRWAEYGGTGDVPDAEAITTAIEADAAGVRFAVRNAAINDALDAVRTEVDLSLAELTLEQLQTAINDKLAEEWGE